MNKKYVSLVVAVAILLGLVAVTPALAATGQEKTWAPGQGQTRGIGNMMGKGRQGTPKLAVIGTVSTINGNTFTVNSMRRGLGGATTTTAYSVDATNATIMKNNATSSLSSVAVGDTVLVQGTISGTNVTATTIRDAVMPIGNRGKGMGGKGTASSSPISQIQGNGQPVVAGKVSTVSGSTISITTNNGNITYSVDASSATITSGGKASSVSSIVAGDTVIVQGAVNGTSITASTVIDQTKPANPSHPGFFGSIGNFFSHLFGF